MAWTMASSGLSGLEGDFLTAFELAESRGADEPNGGKN